MTQPDQAPQRPWLRWIPVGLLLIAIASQAVLMATVNEDRQAGSGFAMFSSVDFGGSRSVAIEATAQGAPVRVQAPDSLAETLETLITSPTDARATDLARALQALDWSVDDGVVTHGETSTETVKIGGVRVVVRGLTADGRTLQSQVLAEGAGR